MLIILTLALGVLCLLAGLYLARVSWMEHHPRYPVWPDDGPQNEFRDQDDYHSIGS